MSTRETQASQKHCSKSILLAFFSLMSALLLTIAAIPSTAEAAVGETRYINVVFDDSSSMNPDDTRWCSAHYAIEVFAAMLGENDELRVFTMSAADDGEDNPDLVISGKDSMQDRIDIAHKIFSRKDADTNFNAAEYAHADLVGRDGDEKWLVILTDGAFNKPDGISQSYVQEKFEEWANEGIHVEYVGFSKEAKEFKSSGNFSSQKINLDEILPKVIAESNKIFGRAELPKSAFDSQKGSLALDIPMRKIIVFAQGENAQVGKLEISGNADHEGVSASAQQTAHVKYADQANRQFSDPKWKSTPPDTKLQGVVAVFNANDELGFPSGDAVLDVGGTDVSIYYQPYVDVELTLTDAKTGKEYPLNQEEDSQVAPGTYRTSYKLKDPFTGEEINSNLIDAATTTYNTRLKQADGEVVEISNGNEITIDEGLAEITGVAVINGEVEVPQKYKLSILAKDLEVSKVSGPNGAIDKYDMASADPIVIKVKKQGVELTEEEWGQTKLYIGSPDATNAEGLLGWLFGTEKSIDAEVLHGSQPGTYEVKLGPHNGSPANTLSGDVPLVFQAVYDPGYGQSYGELETNQQINSNFLLDLLNWLRLHWLQLILLIILALLIAFIVMELRKPRLPKIKPRLQGVDGAPGEELALRYNSADIQHKIWPPWAPETGTIKVSVKGATGDPWALKRRFHLAGSSIGIIATKTNNGKRGLKLSEQSIENMAKHAETRELPAPCYTGEKSVFVSGSGFNFQGMQPHPRKGWDRREETTYRIVF